jgi:hypothetical protein
MRAAMVEAARVFDPGWRKRPRPVPIRWCRSLQYLPAPRSPPAWLPCLHFLIQPDGLHLVLFRLEAYRFLMKVNRAAVERRRWPLERQGWFLPPLAHKRAVGAAEGLLCVIASPAAAAPYRQWLGIFRSAYPL